MKFEERICINATAKGIFSIYMDVENWKQWDTEVKNSCLDGMFEEGSIGRLTPKSGPTSKIQLSHVVPERSFTVKSQLPLCALVFEHELTEKGEITEVIHRVSLSGIASFLFSWLIGKKLRRGLPHTLQGLKKRAEYEV